MQPWLPPTRIRTCNHGSNLLPCNHGYITLGGPTMSFFLSVAALSVVYLLVAKVERIPSLRFRVLPSPRPYLWTDLAWHGVAIGATAISVYVFRPQLSK